MSFSTILHSLYLIFFFPWVCKLFGARLQAFVCLFSMSGYYIYLAREKHIGKQDNIIGVFEKKKKIPSKTKVMFGNSFCFLFSKTYFGEFKEKFFFIFFKSKTCLVS